MLYSRPFNVWYFSYMSMQLNTNNIKLSKRLQYFLLIFMILMYVMWLQRDTHVDKLLYTVAVCKIIRKMTWKLTHELKSSTGHMHINSVEYAHFMNSMIKEYQVGSHSLCPRPGFFENLFVYNFPHQCKFSFFLYTMLLWKSLVQPKHCHCQNTNNLNWIVIPPFS